MDVNDKVVIIDIPNTEQQLKFVGFTEAEVQEFLEDLDRNGIADVVVEAGANQVAANVPYDGLLPHDGLVPQDVIEPAFPHDIVEPAFPHVVVEPPVPHVVEPAVPRDAAPSVPRDVAPVMLAPFDPPGGQSSKSSKCAIVTVMCTVPKDTSVDVLVDFLNTTVRNLELCSVDIVDSGTMVNAITANLNVLSSHVSELLCLQSISFGDGNVTFHQPISRNISKTANEVSPDDDEAVEALLKELIMRKGSINFTGKRVLIGKKQMEGILASLKGQGFNCFTAEIITKKRANLVKYYLSRKTRNQTDWRFFDLVAQLMGDKEFTGDYAEVKDSHDRANFTPDATIMLIYEYDNRKHLFERAVRQAPLWEEVAAALAVAFPLLNITPSGCERKWASLKSLYFDFKGQVDNTGGDSVVLSWPFYEPMQQVLRGSVAADPKCTFAVGSTPATKCDKSKNSNSSKKSQSKKIDKRRTRTSSSSSVSEDEERKRKKQKHKRPKLSFAAQKLKLEEKKYQMNTKLIAMVAETLLKNNKTPTSSSNLSSPSSESD